MAAAAAAEEEEEEEGLSKEWCRLEEEEEGAEGELPAAAVSGLESRR